MRLRALTGLEVEKLEEEWRRARPRSSGSRHPRGPAPDRRSSSSRTSTAWRRPTPRRGSPRSARRSRSLEDEDPCRTTVAVTISHQGYEKRIDLDQYRSQRRGGSGIKGGDAREGDFIERLFLANTKDALLFFTGSGKVHQLKVYKLPNLQRTAIGRAAVNLIPGFLAEDRIQAVIPIDDFEHGTLLFATGNGTVKRTALADYARPKSGGIIALGLDQGDELIDVAVCKDEDEIILGTQTGMSIRFKAADARTMGRPAVGVRGIRLRRRQVCGMAVCRPAFAADRVPNGLRQAHGLRRVPAAGRGGLGRHQHPQHGPRPGGHAARGKTRTTSSTSAPAATWCARRPPRSARSGAARGRAPRSTLAEGDAVASASHARGRRK
jgi:DNA gyrase subunit A